MGYPMWDLDGSLKQESEQDLKVGGARSSLVELRQEWEYGN